jgi:hypothetical protein
MYEGGSMKFHARLSVLLPALLLVFAAVSVVVSCRDMRPRSPEWVASAPEKSIFGISVQLGWALERPEVREAIAGYPIFEQALEIFLDKVKVDLTSDALRASLFVMEIPDPDRKMTLQDDFGGIALIQLAGFGDPKAIQKTVVETFPPEGSLKMGGREYPLFVFFDINKMHLRVFLDSDDRLWIGDIAALQDVAKRRFVGNVGPMAKAAEWVHPSGSLQGFVQPELVPKETYGQFADAVPVGIKGLIWSMSAIAKNPDSLDLSMAATGTDEAIVLLRPWMQRLAAAASTFGEGGAPPPETLHEKTRMGLKCRIRQEHLHKALDIMMGPGSQAISTPQRPGAPK